MSISVVHGSPQTIWAPVNPAATVYVGSLVCLDYSALATSEGVVVRPVAAGASGVTSIGDVPIGVVIGTNNRVPTYSATYKQEYITSEAAAGPHTPVTGKYFGVEGPWNKSENMAFVKIAVINACSVLRAPICNGSIGTAPSLLTATAGDASGLTVTTNAANFTPVAGKGTIYCRTGLNRGEYRVTDDTSTTVAAWDHAMSSDTAVGDTFVRVPLRTIGTSYVTIGDGTVASFIDCAKTPATDYDIIHVLRLDLSEAGKEYAEFTFDGDVFASARA